MQFNPGDGSGIVDEINDICDTDNDGYPLTSKVRRVNNATLDLELQALMADGTWQFDDANYGTQPSGVQSAVDGQSEYSFDATLVMVERIEILLKDGITWLELDQYDEMEGPLTQTDLAVQATPQAYYKRGNKFGFTTVPKSTNMTLASGIKVYFKRVGALLLSTDTTATPGILSTFHPLVCQKASLPYCRSNKKDRVPQLLLDIADGEKKWKAYIANRAKDEGGGQMTMRRTNGR